MNKLIDDLEWLANTDNILAILLTKTGVIILTILFCFISLKIVGRITKKKLQTVQKQHRSLVLLVRMVIKFIILVVTLTIIISQVEVLDNLATTILAASGIAALAVGMAAQESLSNVIGGVSVTTNKKIEIGDFIKLVDKNLLATVEEITLRHTVLRNLNNRMLIVPNKIMATSIIENYSNNDEVCYFLDVGISYDSDVDKAMDIIKEVINSHKDTYKPSGVDDYPKVNIVNFGSSSVDLRAWVWIDDPSIAFDKVCDLRKIVKQQFDAQGIEIPYQYVNVINK